MAMLASLRASPVAKLIPGMSPSATTALSPAQQGEQMLKRTASPNIRAQGTAVVTSDRDLPDLGSTSNPRSGSL